MPSIFANIGLNTGASITLSDSAAIVVAKYTGTAGQAFKHTLVMTDGKECALTIDGIFGSYSLLVNTQEKPKGLKAAFFLVNISSTEVHLCAHNMQNPQSIVLISQSIDGQNTATISIDGYSTHDKRNLSIVEQELVYTDSLSLVLEKVAQMNNAVGIVAGNTTKYFKIAEWLLSGSYGTFTALLTFMSVAKAFACTVLVRAALNEAGDAFASGSNLYVNDPFGTIGSMEFKLVVNSNTKQATLYFLNSTEWETCIMSDYKELSPNAVVSFTNTDVGTAVPTGTGLATIAAVYYNSTLVE
jgi:hypothetical protein